MRKYVRSLNCFACFAAFAVLLASARGATAMERPVLTLTKKTEPARGMVPEYDYGELEFLNRFDVPIRFSYNIEPDQSFIPIVRNEAGEVLSNAQRFGFSRAPSFEYRSFSVAPGESHTFRLRHLLETVPYEKRVAGTYYVRVRLERDGVAWESNEIEVRVKSP